ncbi:hypothetical protein [Solibacillus sp.]|uniref:hypothetical protein n=1 Tax=Solibacillus sp. TaxID=1909654 RepID=UPI0033162B7D
MENRILVQFRETGTIDRMEVHTIYHRPFDEAYGAGLSEDEINANPLMELVSEIPAPEFTDRTHSLLYNVSTKTFSYSYHINQSDQVTALNEELANLWEAVLFGGETE